MFASEFPPETRPLSVGRLRIVFLCLFLAGAGLRALNISKPVAVAEVPWRESDLAGIARNYATEGMNLLYPRIDWRGDGPGYAEMEFPLYPWTIGLLYRILGEHESFCRLVSYALSLATMLVFFRLARYLLPQFSAVCASVFFVLSPLMVYLSTAVQPEGLMLLAYMFSVYLFTRWLDDGDARSYTLAILAASLAILAKLPAANLGIFYAALVLWRRGKSALTDPRVWIFGAASLLPPALWYFHARSLWVTYGNSLGISNVHHWFGWDVFANPSMLASFFRLEVTQAWSTTGLLAGAVAVVFGWRTKIVRFSLFWLGAAMLGGLIAIRTTSASWAFYYHWASVGPAALLFGWGAAKIGEMLAGQWKRPAAFSQALRAAAVFGLAACIAATVGMQVWKIGSRLRWPEEMIRLHESASLFAPYVPANVLIVASGAQPCWDWSGHPGNFNESHMLYWLRRKGFNICVDEQSVDALKALARRGARYFVAEKFQVKSKPGFESELKQTFPLLKETDVAWLFQL